MTSADIQELFSESKCIACFGASMPDMLKIALLSRILAAEHQRITMPFINLSRTTNATGAATNVAYPITFTNIDDSQGIDYLVGDSNIEPTEAGKYLIVVSAVVDSLNPAPYTIALWPRINGTNVDRSNTIVGTQSTGIETTLAVSFIFDLNAADQLSFWYRVSNTNVYFKATAAAVGPPARPICPSVILTMNKISD